MCTLGPLFNHSTIRNAFSWSFRLEIKQTGLSYLEARFWFTAFLLIEPYFSHLGLFKCMSRSVFCQGPTMKKLCLCDFVWLWNPLAALRNCSTSNHSCFVLSHLSGCETLHEMQMQILLLPAWQQLTKLIGNLLTALLYFIFFPPRHPVESVFLWDT